MPRQRTKHRIPAPPSHPHDPDYWRARAEETLQVAFEMTDGDALSRMLDVGMHYERLARRAEERRRKCA